MENLRNAEEMNEVIEVKYDQGNNIKSQAKTFIEEHAAGIVAGVFGVVYVGIMGVVIVRRFKVNQSFIASAKEIYGDDVSQGCVFGGNTKKLLGMRKNWEENSKTNFDKVKKLVGELNLKSGETFTIEKFGKGKNSGKCEIFQMLDNGFFHNEYI